MARRRQQQPKPEASDAIVGAALMAMLRRTSEGESEPPSWFTDLLDALSPLQALAKGHGALPKADAERLKNLQNVLQRADLSKAERPADAGRIFMTIRVLGGSKP